MKPFDQYPSIRAVWREEWGGEHTQNRDQTPISLPKDLAFLLGGLLVNDGLIDVLLGVAVDVDVGVGDGGIHLVECLWLGHLGYVVQGY